MSQCHPQPQSKPQPQCHQQAHTSSNLLSSIIALTLGAIILLGGIFHLWPNIESGRSQFIFGGISAATLTVMLYAGRHFFVGAYHAFKAKVADMNTLISLGTGAAWLYSTIVIVLPNMLPLHSRYVYFDTALLVIGLVNIGAYIEANAQRHTSDAVKKLIELQAKTARVLRDNQIIEIPIKAVELGDHLQIRPGEKAPVDGTVIEGASHVDESMLSGEPIPITKHIGDAITSGSINKEGLLIIEATKVGDQTMLARMIMLVQQAQATRPPVARLVDIIASIFVPIVILIAIVSGLFWATYGPEPKMSHALMTALSVLLIACPCALGLATPISITLGIGKAAEHGILVRNAEALQKMKNVHAIILDKTGTLTEGQPTVSDVLTFHHYKPQQVIQFAHSLETLSTHPLASAINCYAQEQALTPFKLVDFENLPGIGVQAFYKKKRLLLGNETLMRQHNIHTTQAKPAIEKSNNDGKTVILVAYDDELIGLITVSDPIKQDSRDTVAQLMKLGYRVKMLTGDRRGTAKAIAKQIHIKVEDIIAEVLPSEKAAMIAELQKQGWRIAMVGDGINDAPALAQADVGIAMGTSTDIAIEASDITLLSNSLKNVVTAVTISKQTIRNIKQNLFAAFIYNCLAIPIAAGVFYPLTGWLLNPIIAGAAMAASSLTVVLNAMRLRTQTVVGKQ